MRSVGSAAARGARWRRLEREDRKEGRVSWTAQPVREGGSATMDERHAWAQRAHAARRAEERYGVVLDARALRELATGMVDTTTKPGMLYLGRGHDGDNRRSAYWLVMVDDVEMIAAFDETTRCIATFLPMDSRQVAFRDGRFVGLVGGGSRRARDYWRSR